MPARGEFSARFRLRLRRSWGAPILIRDISSSIPAGIQKIHTSCLTAVAWAGQLTRTLTQTRYRSHCSARGGISSSILQLSSITRRMSGEITFVPHALTTLLSSTAKTNLNQAHHFPGNAKRGCTSITRSGLRTWNTLMASTEAIGLYGIPSRIAAGCFTCGLIIGSYWMSFAEQELTSSNFFITLLRIPNWSSWRTNRKAA